MPRQVGSTTVRPPSAREGPELRDGERLVVQRDIVQVDERVLPELAEDLRCTRARRRDAGAPASVGGVPPAAAVVEDMLVHQRHAERVGRNRAQRPSSPCRDRTCASESSLPSFVIPPLPAAASGSRRVEDAGVQPDRDEDDRAGDDLGEERRDVHEDEAVADDGDGQRAEHACRASCRARPCSEVPPSTTAAMTCEFEADGRVRGAGAETRRDQHARDRARRRRRRHRPRRRSTAPACRRGAPPRMLEPTATTCRPYFVAVQHHIAEDARRRSR